MQSRADMAKAAEPDQTGGKKRHRSSLSHLIIYALMLGVACGLFFGEYCGGLSIVGDAYVGLLQMTVLPYIVFSVIGNIGRLSFGESKRLAIAGSLVLVLLWTIGLLFVWLLPLALPPFKTGSFFSTSLLNNFVHLHRSFL